MPMTRQDGIPIHFEAAGTGTPVLFLHGLGSSTDDWEFQVVAFSARHRTVTVDVRGHGQSGKPRGPYRIADFSRDAAAALQAAGVLEPAHVVGISMGGMVALQLALDAPEAVRSLVIVNSGPEVRAKTLRDRLQLLQRRLFTRLLSQRTLGRILGRRLFPDPGQAGLKATMEERWARNDKSAYRETLKAILAWSATPRLGEIRQPTLVVSGDLDYTTVDSKRAWAARMPNARVAVIAHSRHVSPIDQPDAFNAMVLAFFAERER